MSISCVFAGTWSLTGFPRCAAWCYTAKDLENPPKGIFKSGTKWGLAFKNKPVDLLPDAPSIMPSLIENVQSNILFRHNEMVTEEGLQVVGREISDTGNRNMLEVFFVATSRHHAELLIPVSLCTLDSNTNYWCKVAEYNLPGPLLES